MESERHTENVRKARKTTRYSHHVTIIYTEYNHGYLQLKFLQCTSTVYFLHLNRFTHDLKHEPVGLHETWNRRRRGEISGTSTEDNAIPGRRRHHA